MFSNFPCSIRESAERLSHKGNSIFIQTVLEEDRRAKALREQEIQSTAENPRIKEAAQTTQICKELKQYKEEQFIKAKRSQQLRENHQDLRLLQIHIRAAQTSRQLIEQKEALDRKKQDQLRLKRIEDAEYEKQKLATQELFNKQCAAERRKKDNLRKVLLEQIDHSDFRRKQEFEEVLKDRENMNQLLRKLDKEREAEFHEFERRRELCRDEMRQNLLAQEYKKQQERAEKIDENEKYLDLVKKRDEIKRKIDTEKKELVRQRDAISEGMGIKLMEMENEKRRREELLTDLLVEERIAKEDARHRKNLENQLQRQLQVRFELDRYRNETLRVQTSREKKFLDAILAEQAKINAEMDKRNAILEEKRLFERNKHKEMLLGMIESKRQQQVTDAADRMQSHLMLLNAQRKEQQEVEEERNRLLRSQPVEVLRFLPVGTIRQTDYEFLDLLRKHRAETKKGASY